MYANMKSENTLPSLPPSQTHAPQIYTALLNESALCYTNKTHTPINYRDSVSDTKML